MTPEADSSADLLNVREAAQMLGVHENTIRNWAKAGTLESMKLQGSRFHRFRRGDVEALAARRRRSDASLSAARTVIGPELVDATQLHQWAERHEARALFPQLIRRLLAATPGVSAISVRAGEGTGFSGWDGHAQSTGTAYLPAGDLLFELGVGKAAATKAQEDFDKRATELGARAAGLTFVFVTPRRWAGSAKWATTQARQGPFADVRVVDADDLEGWLTEAASVHYWISEQLGRHPKDATTLDRWWERFAYATDPPLPSALFLAGRDAARLQLLQQLEGGPCVVAVTSAWQNDALAFVRAALEDVAELENAGPALVINSASAWERVASQAGSSLLVPSFAESDTDLALRHGHSVVRPLARETAFGAAIDLHPVNREDARESLEGAGIRYDHAYRLSGLARRSMPSLMRRLARDPVFKRPPWSQGADGAALAPLALVGGWTDSTNDVEAVSRIAGTSAQEIERLLLHWREVPDAPFLRSGDRWYLASREDAIALLRGQLTRAQLQTWHETALEVLTELDPSLELPVGERYLAAVKGKKPRFSGALRASLAEGAAALGADGDTELSSGRTGAEHASLLVRALMRRADEDKTGNLWTSLADQLPLLAEAAPSAFLDAVLDDVERAEPILMSLFQDQDSQSALLSSSPHTGLLWALELLACSQEHFPDAVLALAKLAALDPGGRLSNRPLRSLRTILVIWIHQTSATLEQRLTAMDRICGLDPGVGWQLIELLWPKSQAVVSPPSQPRFHDWAPEEREVPPQEWLSLVDRLVVLAMGLAADEPGRWQELVQRFGPLPKASREKLLAALESAVADGAFVGGETDIWEKLREEIGRHRAHPDAHWSLSDDELERMLSLARALEPERRLDRSRHLFSRWPESEGLDKSSYSDYLDRLFELRKEALGEVIEDHGTEGLRELALEAEAAPAIGDILSQAFPGLFEEEILSWLAAEDEGLSELARGWAIGENARHGVERLRELLSKVAPDAIEQRLVLLTAAPAQGSTWDLVDLERRDLIERYWQAMDTWQVGADDVARAVDELLKRGRAWPVVHLLTTHLHNAEDGSKPFDPDLARQALEAALHDDQIGSLNASMSGYEVGTLLDYLEGQGVDHAVLGGLEYAYFALLEDYRTPTALYAELARNAELFVEFVQRVYRGANQQPRQLSAEEEQHAHQAWLVLHNWRTVPGQRDDGSLDGDHLKQWVTDARFSLSELDRADIGDEQIGQLLASSPPGPDGVWPPEPVRDLIETIGSTHFETGLNIGRINNRGITSRGVYDGGEQERDLASRYAEWARATADRWRRTSRLLRELAEEYERDARREDLRASVRSDLD